MDRETLDVDVLIVGGGPAGMSAALRLAQLQKAKGGEPLAIAVLEKAREAGAHMLSGAVLDPSALAQLVPDFKERGAPLASEVHHDHVYFLTRAAQGHVSDHAAAAREPRQLHHLAQPVRASGSAAWSRPRASTSSRVSRRPRCSSTATAWPACEPAIAASASTASASRRSSLAWTSARR